MPESVPVGQVLSVEGLAQGADLVLVGGEKVEQGDHRPLKLGTRNTKKGLKNDLFIKLSLQFCVEGVSYKTNSGFALFLLTSLLIFSQFLSFKKLKMLCHLFRCWL